MKTNFIETITCILICMPIICSGQWSTDTLSQSRHSLASCKIGDKLIFAGGFSYTPFGSSKRVDIFDISTSTWSIDSLFYARSSMMAAATSNLAFFVGSTGVDSLAKLLEIYNTTTGLWEKQFVPTPGGLGAIAINSGKVFIAGGSNVHIYDIASGQWSSQALSFARGGVAILSISDKVIFAGGSYNFSENKVNTVDIYDVTLDTWSVDTISEDRSNMSAVAVGNKAYFAGGLKENFQRSKRIDIYDVSTGEWSIDSLSKPKGYLAAVHLNGKIFFAGGDGHFGNGIYNDVEIYNTIDNQWSMDKLSIARHSLTAIAEGNKAYFVGGGTSSGSTNIIDIYDDTETAIKEPSLLNKRISVFPNPCEDIINFEIEDLFIADKLVVMIYSMDGRLLKKETISTIDYSTISTKSLPEGSYIINILNGIESFSTLFVKK